MGLKAVDPQSSHAGKITHELHELDNQIHLLKCERNVKNLLRQAFTSDKTGKNELLYGQFVEGYITTSEFIQSLNVPEFLSGLRYELAIAYISLNEAKSIQGVK